MEPNSFIPFEHLPAAFKRLGKHDAVTTTTIEEECGCSPADLAWNHMDQLHRKYIHNTYTEAVRFAITPAIAVSLTKVKFAGIPFFILVSDIKLKDYVFYQCFTLMGLIYFHMQSEILPVTGGRSKYKLTWHIVSHRFLKFLHQPLSRAYINLTKKQNREDEQIHVQRTAARKSGFRFRYDDRSFDFITSNTLTSNTCFPSLKTPQRISLAGLQDSRLEKIGTDAIQFLILKNPGSEESYTLWTETCAHEGGSLSKGKLCNGQLECPWHGLKFSGVTVSAGKKSARIENCQIKLEGKELVIEAASS